MEDKSKHISKRVLLATLAALTLEGCQKLKDGDPLVTTSPTTCWRYPGGMDASRAQAPLGQENHGLIDEGTPVTVESRDGNFFDPQINGFVRVQVNNEDLTLPGDGDIWKMVDEKGNELKFATQQTYACWVARGSLAQQEQNRQSK